MRPRYNLFMERKIEFSEGEYYHAYNRGTDKRKIFLDFFDKDRFTRLLYLCNNTKPLVMKLIDPADAYSIERGEQLVDIGAWCTMWNHFHLLLRERVHGGISKFMLKLATAYSMYFNEKHKRTGTLFEGKFKAKHLDTDEYLKYVVSYIHLNPIEHIEPDWKETGLENINKAWQYLRNYNHSSALEYLGVKRDENKILNLPAFPKYFEQKNDFETFLNDWLTYSSDFHSKGGPWSADANKK